MILHHLTTRSEWDAACGGGSYRAPSLESEGFIHFSTSEQVVGTAVRFYADVTDLVVLDIDAERCGAEIRWEPPAHPGGDVADQLFPHLYGALEIDAVTAVRDVAVAGDQVSFSP